MSRWTDLAKWVGPTPNQSGAMNRHDGVVLHIAAGTYLGTIAWQRNPDANVSSHFIVSKTGEIAQMVDTDVTAWTQRDGNGEWLSVENAGFLPDALTAAQVEANAKILARAHVVYGVPLQVTNTPTTRGLGHHSMGAENGINWGHPACPGDAIKAQKAAIVARAKEIVSGEDDMTPAEARMAAKLGFYDALTEAAQRNTVEGRWMGNQFAILLSDVATEDEVAAIAAKDFTDEPAIVEGVLAGLSPEAIAASIPADLARQVADELATRLQD